MKNCLSEIRDLRDGKQRPIEKQKLLPTISLPDLCGEIPPIELASPLAVDGNISLYELVVISALVRHYDPKNIFEIGTFDGRTAVNLSANLKAGRVFTLDLPKTEIKNTGLQLGCGDTLYIDKDASGLRFRGTRWEERITQLYGDSATFDFAPYEGTMDFVFIDGSHSYPYVMNDSKKALPLLRNGQGIILWHDYPGWPGVSDALHELFLTNGAFRRLRTIENTSFAILQK